MMFDFLRDRNFWLTTLALAALFIALVVFGVTEI